MSGRSSTKTQVWMVVAGVAVVVGFFLPLFEYQGAKLLSGWELLREADLPARYWLLTVSYPILGAALIVTALAGVSSARWISLGIGGVIILYPLYMLISSLIEVAGTGAFLMFGGGLVALICGLVGGAAKPGKAPAAKS